jgi:hypothetical protein
MSKYKIAVGFISGDSKVHYGVLASFIEFAHQDMSGYEFTPLFQSSIYVDRNRTYVAAQFVVETDCDYLLLLDSDNGITKEGLDYFMEDFKDPEVNIVTGKYLYRGSSKQGLMVCGYQPHEAALMNYLSLPENAFTEDLVNLTKAVGKGVVGCGCLMIRRKVLEEVPYPWFQQPWLEGPGAEGRTGYLWVGEDVFFSFHVQEHGFDIHLDQRIKSPHYQGKACYPPEWDQVNATDVCVNVQSNVPTITKD